MCMQRGRNTTSIEELAAEPHAYLSLRKWARADGFFDLDNLTGSPQLLGEPLAPRPIRMPRSVPVIATVRFLLAKELDIFRMTRRVLKHHCARSGATFVDSGHNEGSWSLMAAAYGCNVLAIDPQPHCGDLLRAAAIESGLTGRITMRNHVLAVDQGNTTAITNFIVRVDQCHGTSAFKPGGIVTDSTLPGRSAIRDIERRTPRSRAHEAGSSQFATVTPISVDSLLAKRDGVVELWHLDVEGGEVGVLESAATALRGGQGIRRVMLEFMPWRWANFNVELNHGFTRCAGVMRGWHCVWTCSIGNENTLPKFEFDRRMFANYLHMINGKQKMCENVYCVAPDLGYELRTVSFEPPRSRAAV